MKSNKEKKKKKKNPSLFKMLNPKNLATEVHRYGYDFSLTNYLQYLALGFIVVGIIGYLFGLKLPFLCIILGAYILCLPTVLLTVYRSMYEQKKFMDTSTYIEQLIFSFKRRSKILNALQEVLEIFPDGEMHDAIIKAVEYIQKSNTTGNIYQEAFAFIEKDYGCPRVYSVHRFLTNVETRGGDFEDSLEILLTDRKFWVDRVHVTQQEKKNIRSKITISTLLSFLICGMALLMLPPEFDIKGMLPSQIATTIVFVANMLIWVFAQKKLSGSWIREEDEIPFSKLKRAYDRVMYPESRKKANKQALIFVVALVIGAIFSYFVLKNTTITVLCVVFAVLMYTTPKRKDRSSRKKITREVEKAFPEWLLSIALLLQTNNLHVAISKTITDAPEILRLELERLLEGIDENPNRIDPYHSFFHQLDLPEVRSAMTMLYSMAEYGTSNDVSKQIASLMERNAVLMDKAERLRTEDKLAGISFIVLLPMLTGTIKMLVDMLLLVVALLTQVAI